MIVPILIAIAAVGGAIAARMLLRMRRDMRESLRASAERIGQVERETADLRESLGRA